MEQDRIIAKALAEFRLLGRLVTKHSRQDDIRFFQTVMEEGSHYLSPHQSRDLWKVIKRALPKYRQRRVAVDPLRMMALEDEWNPHFEALEAGCIVETERLLAEVACPLQQVDEHNAPTIADLPTLFELEQTLRANRTGRATGHDPLSSALFHNHAAALAEHAFPLMMKMWIWGEEPIQYKGGPMALIPKVPQPVEVKHYRGILLLPTLAKSFHALLRKKVIQLLDHRRLPGQLGGFAGQEVLFGSQVLRVLGRTALAKGLSIGVLFVDLSTAFHCLIREMVVGIADHHKLQYVFDALQWTEDSSSRLRFGQAIPCLLEQLGAPAYLVRLLQNIHDSTWTTINGKEFIRTHRGTRPGSPLADVIFHYIMFDFSIALRDFLQVNGYVEKFDRHLSMDVDMIIWSDDLAVPIIEEHAADLIPSLLHLLDFVRTQFAQRGFKINLNKGKTCIVATFSGNGAAPARRQFQLIPQPGTSFEFSDGTEQFVHITPAYRHLGTLYTSDQNLDTEISHRIGIARSAFEQLRRRLMANKHLPLKIRLQLFSSLILSKLYFAAGSWHTPTGRQLERIRNAVGRMIKAIVGPSQRTKSMARTLAQMGILDPRVRLAVERLLYAQRLFHHGPAFLQLMTHAEAAQHSFSWMTGLQHDLRWLYGVEAVADPGLLATDLTELIEIWQQDAGRWRARVRRASQRHLFQDLMIHEVQQWHADIFHLLRHNAFTFDPDPALLHLQERLYQCPDCERSFTTPQGVHTHRRKKHGVFCQEHHLLDSATCPACLTYMWSTQRLQQHLSYMPRNGTPNPCFAYLQQIGYMVSYSAEHIPKVMHGQSRLDALPASGPFGCGPTASERYLAGLRTAKLRLEAEIHNYVQPADSEGAGERLGDILTAATYRWFADFRLANFDFAAVERPQDRWIDVLCKLPSDFESWVARVFILWGRHVLPDIIDSLVDGEAEFYLDEEYAELAAEFDEFWHEAHLRRIERQIAAAEQAQPAPLPHRPVRPPQKDGKPRTIPQLEVPRLFTEQEKWQADLKRVQWQDMPQDPLTPLVPGLAPRPSFLIVHLFAGRRRDHDIHSWLEAWAQRRNFALTILSLDTAISPVLGNLDQNSETWNKLQEAYLSGYVAATISGHPCETFSSARWTTPPPELQHQRWPRPLRTVMQLFGLDHRKMRELRQTRAGSAFFLQTVWTLACHLVFGGIYIEEHPGVPRQPHHPSIWRSAILNLFRQHPDVRFHEIGQWRFGAASVKPTGLLTLRMPYFIGDLFSHADPHAERPTTAAIGVDDAGLFRTAIHKEYPCRLSAGLAQAIAAQLQRQCRDRLVRSTCALPPPLVTWIKEVAANCAAIRSEATWLPDYQG